MSTLGAQVLAFRDGMPRRSRRACERCHSRKVRCDVGSGTGPCSICTAHGSPCKRRVRRRKASLPSTAVFAAMNRLQTTTDGESNTQDRVSVICTPNSRTTHAVNDASDTPPSIGEPISSSLLFTPGPVNMEEASMQSDDNQRCCESPSSPGILSRNSVFGDYPGVDCPETSSPSSGTKEFKITMSVLRLYHAFDLPTPPVRQSLCEAFFENCWTWMPVVDLDVLHEYPSKQPSILIQQAMFLAGSRTRKVVSEDAAPEDFYLKTKALLDTKFEKDLLLTLAALCMVQWWNPAAPTNVSIHTSRFWVTYGIGLAQQLGLHHKPDRRIERDGLRRRIWWTLYARDCLISASHSRPRVICDEDCTIEPPSVNDFPQPSDLRAQIFVSYVGICGLLSRLCQMITRKGLRPSKEKDAIGLELLAWIENLPPELRMTDRNGIPKPYHFEISQLHIPFLSAVTLLFNPRPIFSISPDNAAAVTASTLAFRIYEAFHLRDQISYLGPIFSWHLLIASVTRLSCLRVPALEEEATVALDTTDKFLAELGKKWPSALNNLKNLQVLKRDANAGRPGKVLYQVAGDRDVLLPVGPLLFKSFGSQATKYFSQVESMLLRSQDGPASSDMNLQSNSEPPHVLDTGVRRLNGEHTVSYSSINENGLPTALPGTAVESIAELVIPEVWDQLDDFLARDLRMVEGMEDSYPTNYFTPTLGV